jgi:hypothetical protein
LAQKVKIWRHEGNFPDKTAVKAQQKGAELLSPSSTSFKNGHSSPAKMNGISLFKDPTSLTPEEQSAISNLKTQMLSLLEKEGCRNLFMELLEANCQQPAILAAAVQQLFKDGLPTEKKEMLRTLLSSAYPQMEQYVQYPFWPHMPRLFKCNGARLALDYIAKKPKKPLTLPCTLMESPSAFYAHVEKELKNKKATWPQTFIVHTIEDPEIPGHYTPFYIEKDQKGQLCIYNTDSVGSSLLMNTATDFRGFLDKLKQLNGPGVQFYYYEQSRQADRYNCPLFCIHDIIQFCKTGSRGLTITQRRGGMSPIHELPFGFFTPAQKNASLIDDLIALQKWKNLSEEGQEAIAQVEKKIQKYRDEETKRNLFAERQGDKLEGIIWYEVIASSPNPVH